MKLSINTLLLTIVGSHWATSASASPSNLQSMLDGVWPASGAGPTDDQIIATGIHQLYAIGNSTDYDDCGKCKTRLLLAKTLSLTKPNLVPDIFSQWCIESGYFSKTTCELHYNRDTIKRGNAGSNYVDMVSLMDPTSLDGDYFCYFIEDEQCPYREAPKIDASALWGGSKPDKYTVAPEPGNETITVLHVSDFHIELDYVVGGEANCSASMCCTPHSHNTETVPNDYDFSDAFNTTDGFSFWNSSYVEGIFQKGSWIGPNESSWEPANTFGSYFCDAPEILINNSLDSITNFQKQKNITFDFAIFTGDLVDHDEAQYISYEDALNSEVTVFRDVKYKLQDVPVYAVLGNHDTFPYAQLAQNKYGFSNKFDWNNQLMGELWKDFDWIDYEEQKQVNEHYTGFSVTTSKGLKVISLNSNSWYQSNYYGYINMTNDWDSFGQFEFLVNELLESEAKDQRVWLIMHVPAGADMLPTSSQVFSQVVERFSPYTIAGIFNGHTHRDEFKILYSNFTGNNTEAQTEDNVVAHTWIAPSVTAWRKLNPSFRFLEVDTETFSVMDAFTYYTRLNETFINNGSEPVWELEYNARTDYHIEWPETSPLNATYWHRVAQKMRTSNDTVQLYENYATRFSPYLYDCKESGDCDDYYCYVSTFTIDQFISCCEHFGVDSGY